MKEELFFQAQLETPYLAEEICGCKAKASLVLGLKEAGFLVRLLAEEEDEDKIIVLFAVSIIADRAIWVMEKLRNSIPGRFSVTSLELVGHRPESEIPWWDWQAQEAKIKEE